MTEMETHADEVAAILSLMANSKRLMILCRLAESEHSVGALAEAVGLSQSALSQHLTRLRKAGAVATRRERQTIYYRLADERVAEIMAALYELFCRRAGRAEATD